MEAEAEHGEVQELLEGSLVPHLALASKTFDLDGFVALDLDGDREALTPRSRRATVTATLDGAVVVDDGGFAHGDREWDVRVRPSVEELEVLKNLVENYPTISVSTKEGVFTAVPQRLTTPSPLLFQLRLLIVSKEA
jgi:hypothetical protein